MIIQLCKKSVERVGAAGKAMLGTLRDNEHSIVLKDCLDRCMACDKGLIIATVEGTPVSGLGPDKILAMVEALAEDE